MKTNRESETSRYQFDESELLSLFYEVDPIRPKLSAPYLKDGYVCATDTHIMVRIKAEVLNREYNEVEDLNLVLPSGNCNFKVSLKEINDALAAIPQIDEEIEVRGDKECPECDGEGGVEWEYIDQAGKRHYKFCDCPVCDGTGYIDKPHRIKTGKKIPAEDCPIQIRSVIFESKYLYILRRAMEIIGLSEIRCIHQKLGLPCIFVVDENIEIVIMPFRGEPAKYQILGKDVEK